MNGGNQGSQYPKSFRSKFILIKQTKLNIKWIMKWRSVEVAIP